MKEACEEKDSSIDPETYIASAFMMILTNHLD
jgi:hypothetical protein